MNASLRTRTARLDNRARSVLLDLLLAAIALLSLAAGVAAVVQPVNQLTQPGGVVPVELTPEAQQQALGAVTGLPSGTWLELDPHSSVVDLHVFDLTWPLRLLTEAGPSLLLGCLALGGLLLFRTLRSIRDGSPFDPGNPRRLRLLGLLVVIGGMGSQVVEGFARMAVLDATGLADAGPVQLSATLELTWILAGVCALAFAEAFARGRALSDDVDGLV